VIVCLDQEKAYDKIWHDFLWTSMAKVGLPENFIRCVKALYGGGETVIILNREITASYTV